MRTPGKAYPQAYASARLLLLALFLAGCSGGGGSDAGGSCDVEQQNRFVHENMLDRYYWYRQVPAQVDYARFDSPSQILDYLRYARYDRFSYIASQSEFENLFQDGTYIGYGFSYVVEGTGSVRIRFVYRQSPADNAGMLRGDQLLAINGQDVAFIVAADSWDSVFGAAQIGLPLSLRLRHVGGTEETLTLSKDTVTINTVLHSEVIDSAPNRIGYLVFSSFLSTSVAELDTVFTQFKLDGVNRLVLDLRYNGGGSVDVARRLASYIRSTVAANSDLFVELRYNDRHPSGNIEYYFQPEPGSLALDELTVITTESTCSASEIVVAALKPYLSRVTTIGATSCGKPVGMNPVNFCDKTLLAINFAIFNADGEGDYYSGIAADCAAVDDVGKDFGDPSEPMLRAARYYVDNQVCQAMVARQPRPPTELRGLRAIAGAV